MNENAQEHSSQPPLTPFTSGELAGAGILSPSLPSPAFPTRRVPSSPPNRETLSRQPDFETAIDTARYETGGATPRKRVLAAYLRMARNTPGIH